MPWTLPALAVLLCLTAAAPAGEGYLRENVHDETVGRDEALVNVRLANARWPDCYSLDSAMADIWRIEGVADRERHGGQARAMALWKWFRILVSSTGGGYAHEGPADEQRIVRDPYSIFAEYGHHMCDGLSWAMVSLWRAGGEMALDECTRGHTTAALRYRDADGRLRYHSFDPQRRYYWWDERAERVSTRSMPVMTGLVFRHVTQPRRVRTMRTSLRMGERIERLWHGSGAVIPGAFLREPYTDKGYYRYRPGRTKGVWAVAGEQVRTFAPPADPSELGRRLAEGSGNLTCTAGGKTLYHPAEAGKPGVMVFRLAPPFPIVDARFQATLHTAGKGDAVRIFIRRDGGPWRKVHEKTGPGPEAVRLELGRQARRDGRPDLYTAYNALIKVEMHASGGATDAAISSPSVTTRRMFNKRTQPNLMPGENTFRVSADRLAEGQALRLEVDWELEGKKRESIHTIAEFPYYFRIDAPGVKLREIDNYDQDFGNEAVRMLGYRMYLVPLTEDVRPDESLPAEEAESAFAAACPHPAAMGRPRPVKRPETDPRQTSGFFPQSDRRLPADDRMKELIAQLRDHRDGSTKAWAAAQELGNYPAAHDVLIKRLETASIDLTVFLAKALAQIGDRRSVEPLLAKWELAPRGAPGTRYIPDALAAVGDRSAVPALVGKLGKVRFDFRLHIARALGELGGPEAEAALRDLAANDPFPPVRREAAAALKKLADRDGPARRP
jgi:hypothetical protein